MIVNIAIRVDASIRMGSGHVMRCLALADALKIKGVECQFICREHPGNLILQIIERGYQVYRLPMEELNDNKVVEVTCDKSEPALSHWLGTNWKIDAELTSCILEGLHPDWLVVDHYALDEKWESAVSHTCHKIMVIDDLADRKHNCELLLDQTYGRNEKDYETLVSGNTTLLLGSQYALLREEFAKWREYSLKRRVKPELKCLLITMGGVDPENVTGQLLEALKKCDLPSNLTITVVMGVNAPHIEAVKNKAMEMPNPTEVKVNVINMAKLMVNSDLAIGAAGSTSWERCCLGLPTLLLVLAENQWFSAKSLQEVGAVRLLGDASTIGERLVPAMTELPGGNTLAQMSHSACKITDGQGATRTIQYLESLQ